VPRTREALEALPGVGRKTANVILNTAFGEAVIAVDTHIFRVANRTGLAPGKDVVEVERKLDKTTPDAFKLNAHHWLILHGRYTCVARAPKCPECVILDLCEFRHKNLPNPKPVAKTTRAIVPAATMAPPPRARGRQPMIKTARAGAKRGRGR
jgi:endonuclease-3